MAYAISIAEIPPWLLQRLQCSESSVRGEGGRGDLWRPRQVEVGAGGGAGRGVASRGFESRIGWRTELHRLWTACFRPDYSE